MSTHGYCSARASLWAGLFALLAASGSGLLGAGETFVPLSEHAMRAMPASQERAARVTLSIWKTLWIRI